MTAIANLSAESSMHGRALRRAARLLRLAACVLLASCALNAWAACPLEAPRSRVTDPAGVLGDKANALAERLANYQAATGHQVAVLLVPSLGTGMSIEECAVTVFKQWKLGRNGIDDGVLLLVAVKERKMRIEVGYGLEGSLTDAQSSRIIREVMGPLLARGDYAEGIDRGLDAIIPVVGPRVQSVPPSLPEPAPALQDPVDQSAAKAVMGSILVVCLMVTARLGIGGLLVFGIPALVYAHWIFRDWRGDLLTALIVTAWCVQRWRLIRTNVRRFHLTGSGNNTLPWIWYFLASGLAQPEPSKKSARRRKAAASDDGSFSFVSSDDNGSSDSSDSGSSSGGSDDGGGASGGGGASSEY
ncbi:MAG: TPM domain-containing protein [Pseudomonadota bacterium]|nr:TPM domain-containing protein [Pseudomonadota bacterium]